MHIIDPLKLKLDELLSEGNANVLNHARLRYGTEKDLHVLLKACEAAGRAASRGLLLDFTPFDRIGRPADFLDAIAKVGRHARPALLVNGLGLLSQLKAARKKLPLEVAQFDDDGKLLKLHGSSQSSTRLKDVIKGEFTHRASAEPPPLVRVRRRFANDLLTEMLFRRWYRSSKVEVFLSREPVMIRLGEGHETEGVLVVGPKAGISVEGPQDRG